MNLPALIILLVEDNPDHAFLARKAIVQEMGSDAEIFAVGDAEAAMDFLHGTETFTGAPRPDLILLDVQLPRRDGFWVLRMIKDDPALRSIPVVVFTSSDADSDVQRAYQFGTNIYVCKPTGPDEFAARIRAIPAFWSRIAHLPRQEARAHS
jgi:two-component system, chemotaxis family, response regulator Rcp1